MIKDVSVFNGRSKACIDDGVKVRVKGLKDRDGTFVSCFWFINECAASDFHGFWENASSKSERDKLLETVYPIGVHTSKDIESETLVTRFRRNILDSFNHTGKGCGEGGSFGGRVRDKIEWPSSFGSVGRCFMFCNELTKVSAVERECVCDVIFVRGGKCSRVGVIRREITMGE